MGRTVKHGVEVEGRYKGQRKLQDAAKDIKAVETASEKAKKQVSQMPERFGKAASAASLLSGSMGSLAGGFGTAGQRIADMAVLLSSGGPFGIAIAAATGAIAAAAFAWDSYNQPAEDARRINDQLNASLQTSIQRLTDQRREVDQLADSLDNFGEGSAERELRRLERDIELRQQLRLGVAKDIASNDRKIATLQRLASEQERSALLDEQRIKAGGKSAEALRAELAELTTLNDAMRARFDVGEQVLDQDFRKLEIMRESARRAEAEVSAEDRKREAQRAAADAERRRREEFARSVRAESFWNEWQRKQEEDKTKTKERETNERIRLAQLEFDSIRMQIEAQDRAAMRTQKAETARMQVYAQVGDSIGNLSGAVASSMGEQAAATAQAVTQIISEMIAMAITVITASAGSAAGKAADTAANSAPYPINMINMAVAVAQSLATIIPLVATVANAGGGRKGFAQGGFVTGGIPGVDTVPINAQSGEFVMSTDEVGGMRSILRKFGAAPSDSQPSARGGSKHTTVINNMMWMPDTEGQMRMSRKQVASRRRLARRGMLE